MSDSDSSNDPEEYVKKANKSIDDKINDLKHLRHLNGIKKNNSVIVAVRNHYQNRINKIEGMIEKLLEEKKQVGNGIKKKSNANIYSMPKKGGLSLDDVKNFASKAISSTADVAKVVAPFIPLILSAMGKKGGKKMVKDLEKKGSKKLVQKKAPKKTPEQFKPWMRVVETVRADPKHKDKPYKEILKIAKKIYAAEKP